MAVKRKVKYAGFAGAFTVLLAWGLEEFASIKIPATVASAVTTLLSFGTGYATNEPDDTLESK